MRGPPGTFKRVSWGLPRQPSPALPSPRQRQAQALARVERRRQRQEATATGLCYNLPGRWLTNAAGLAGRGLGVEGMGCALAGPAFVGLCRALETTSGAVPAQTCTDCSEEPTASASSPVHIPFRMHEPAPCRDSNQLPGQCGKQGPRMGALHCLRPATPLERKIPVQLLCSPWGGRRHCKSQAFTTADLPRQVPQMGHSF